MAMKLNYKRKKKRGQRPTIFLTKNRKGISTIIVTVLLIGLTIIAVGMVWAVVNNLIRGKIANSEACFGNFGKVSINPQYTCYKKATSEFQFSLSIGDIDVEKVIIGISAAGTTKSYTIPAVAGTYSNVKKFVAGTYGEALTLPEKNAGTTYVTKDFTSKPDLIRIIPVINGQQCDVSDTLSEIDNCMG